MLIVSLQPCTRLDNAIVAIIAELLNRFLASVFSLIEMKKKSIDFLRFASLVFRFTFASVVDQ